jgi:hypothetical protein
VSFAVNVEDQAIVNTPSRRSKSKGPANQAVATPVVRVIVTATHLALVDPPVPLLLPLLKYTAFTFEGGGPTGYRRAEHNVEVAAFDFRGRLAIPAGLLTRCCAELAANGYQVEVEDCRRFGLRFEVDEQFVAEADSDVKPLLEAMTREPLGQVEVRGFADAVEKTVLVHRIFSKARLVVALATKRQAWRFWRSLEDVLDERVGLRCAGHRRAGTRCWVTTHQQLGDVAAKAHILLLPDAGGLAGDVAVRAVAEAGVPRVYAFVPVPAGAHLDRRTRIRLEGMAGPVIHRLRPRRAGVSVLLIKTPGGVKLTAKGETGLARKRSAYWGNKSRNKAVVAAVRAFLKGDAKELRRLGLVPLHAGPKSGFAQARVAVIVESTEHGRNLRHLLPGAILLDAVPREKGSEGAQDCGPTVPLIITEMVAAKEGVDADVLIRATGGASPLAVKDFPPFVTDVGDGKDVLLVDIDDVFDKAAMDDTASRINAYQARGFKLPGAKRGKGTP